MKKTILLCMILQLFQLTANAQTLLWSTLIDTVTTFSSPRAVHLNADGVADLIIGGGLDGVAHSNGIIAIDGATGNELWHFATEEEIFASAIFRDITGDNIADIFLGGRYAEFYAINGATGAQIWEFFPHPPTQAVDSGWFNFYTPQWIPDQNADNIPEILVANGGNHALQSWITNRDPGYLVVINPMTGDVLARDTMPDGEETYCSAVVVDFLNNGNLEIIFGSGGEDDGGSLWRVPLSSLMANNIDNAVALASHPTRGFIAPPSLADMNNDGVLDIICQAYNGTVTVFNGSNNQILWTLPMNGKESSAAPVIGNFTGDITPDIFAVLGKGHAPSYTDYYQVMIDGATGQITWMDSIGQLHFSSANAADLNLDGRDEVIVSLNYHTGSFKHRLLSIDFQNDIVSPLYMQEGGVNLGTTPLVQDLDGNGFLDIVYAFRADSINPMGAKGFRIKRLTTNYAVPPVGVAWGSYMGTAFDGVYNYQGTPCGTINTGLSLANISCNGFADGRATTNPSGGTAPYTFLWSTGGIGDTLEGIDVGTYNLRVTDALGCYIDQSFAAADPFVISFGGLTMPTCVGDSNAMITVGSTGCVCMFSGCTYSWSNGASITKTGIDLWAGWQYVTITHLGGCVVVDSVLIPNPPPLIKKADLQNLPCYTHASGLGAIQLTLNYPTTTTLTWSNGSTSTSISGLLPGSYSVNLSSSIGCTDFGNYTIQVPDTIQISATPVHLTCHNNNAGQILINPSGGTMPYYYNWSQSGTTQNISNLTSNYYSVTLTDSLGCIEILDSIFITEPSALVVNTQGTDATVGCNGTATATASGATPIYTYLWNNSETTASITSLCGGTYTVTVIDAYGCEAISSVTISFPSNTNTLHSSTTILNVYPNPATSILWIEGLAAENKLELSVIDALGRRVVYYHADNNSLDKLSLNIADLPAGHYSLLLRSDGAIKGTKLFVKN